MIALNSQKFFEDYKQERREKAPFVDFMNLSLSEIEESLTRIILLLNSHEMFQKNAAVILFGLLDHLTHLYLNAADKSLVIYMRRKVQYGSDVDPSTQYRVFVDSLRTSEVRQELFELLPVLEIKLRSTLRNWESYSLSILNRLRNDFEVLLQSFGVGKVRADLSSIECGLSDPHCGQQSVALLDFEDFKVIYKPRQAAVEKTFQDFISWINGHLPELKFRQIHILDHKAYSWHEYITADPCQSLDDVEAFYQRTGGYMALFYFFGCTDLHYENVIASGPNPMFIDLETLFQPSLEKISLSEDDTNRKVGTVMRSGLLPKRLWGDDTLEGTDVGGISGTGGTQSSSKAKVWENPGTIFAKQGRAFVQMPKTKNVPIFEGKIVEIWRYESAVEWGFRLVYDFMRTHFEEFVAPGGLFEAFLHCPVRVLLRNTSTYETLLSESSHPSLLKSRDELVRYLEWIRKDNKGFPGLQAVVDYEIRAIEGGDIPMFYSTPASTEIKDSEGRIYEGMVSLNAETICRWRVGDKLHPSDLERQINFIKMGFAVLKPHFNENNHDAFESSFDALSPSELKEVASAGYQDVGKFAGTDFGICVPMQLAYAPGKGHFIGFLDVFDYHRGLPGSLLASLYLGLFHQQKWPEALDHYVDYFLGRLKKEQDRVNTIGAAQGHGGIIYALSHIFHLSGRADIKSELDYHVQIIADLIPFSKDISLGDGLAGALVGLSSYFHVTRDAFAADLMQKLIEKIQALATDGAHDGTLGGWNDFLKGNEGVSYALALGFSALEGKEAPTASGPEQRRRHHIFEFGLNGGADGFAFAALKRLAQEKIPDINVFELPRAFA